MKASLVAKLIEAHCSGDESLFERALHGLTSDEENKGNGSVAAMLRGAYRQSTTFRRRNDATPLAPASGQGFLSTSAPRDKESSLNLYEIVQSDVSLSNVVLRAEQLSIINQMMHEHRNRALLESQDLLASNRLLLCGPPGCGKTMTAMAIANSLGYPVAYVRLDGLVSSYLGQTSTNLRRVFDSIRSQEVVLFLDEFDAIAKKRDDNHELGELKRVVITLLQNFDGMPSNVFLIAATNHEHLLDPAIWRRFNATVRLDLPDLGQRIELLRRALTAEHRGTVDISLLARLTQGSNASDIGEIVHVSRKEAILSGKTLTTDRLVKTFIKHFTLYSNSESDEFWNRLAEIRNRGVSLRNLEEATGIPRSTISYRFQKGVSDGE